MSEELPLDSVVWAERPVGGIGPVRFYGVVDAIEGGTSYSAHVRITRIMPEIYVPPRVEINVQIARQEQAAVALHFDAMSSKVAAGSLSSGEPAKFNLDFLCGEKGAHANISGISGVATKTSYALFLLYSVFQTTSEARGIIFNVKGSDLLFLDKPNVRLTEADRQHYSRLGLTCGPFPEVAYHGVGKGLWTLRQFAERGLIRYFFNDIDQSDALDFAADRLSEVLQAAAAASPPDELIVAGQKLESIEQLCKLICDTSENPKSTWFENVATNTRRALVRRLKSISKHVRHLIGGDGTFNLDKQLNVIDLHRLTDKARFFVVGSVLHALFEEREDPDNTAPTTYLVLDELNKYAPRKSAAPIRQMLLDIAERGRSLGIILIGAQQTASEVEERIVGNAALRIAGRLENAEAENACYGWLPSQLRQRATLIQPGTMLISQPQVPVPLVVHFPFPAWATRKSEVAD